MTHLASKAVAPLLLSSLALLPPVLASAPVSGAAPAQDAGLTELVTGEIAEAGDRDAAELLRRALELRGADNLGAGAELDAALDQALKQDGLGPRPRLLLASARLFGEDPDLETIANTLQEVLAAGTDGEAELALAAAGLLGDTRFRSLNRGTREDIAEALLETAGDAEADPNLRMRFAQSAFVLAVDGGGRNAARKVLRDFLRSDAPDLRGEAALALASSAAQPIEGALRRELERLQLLPDDRGGMASSLLKEERLREHYERKLADQRQSLGSGTIPPDLKEFQAVLNMIERSHLEGSKVSERELIEAGIQGMLQWMDQHSSYLSSESYAQFFQDLEAEYGGIGAYVNTDPDTGLFTIVQPIYSGPAYEAGLKTDDKIVRIDDWPTLGKDREDIIKRLKGKPGTPVKLYVWRRGMDTELIDRPTEDMIVTVNRALVEIPAGTWQLLPGGIGLVELSTFSRVAREELKTWLSAMQENGMRALILDMRRNSGGLLDESREVAELFLDKGKVVVSTEGRGQRRPQTLKTRRDPLLPPDMPIVILTSRMTASAAEIVSGALQDHGRATLVGKTTFGKGSVQQLLPVAGMEQDDWRDETPNGRWDPWEPLTVDHDGDGEMDYAPRVKLTIARYLLPSGRSIHRELDDEGNLISTGGVEADIVVDFPSIENWERAELSRVLGTGFIDEYVDRNWDEHRSLFNQLALNDGRETSLYPEFDQLMTHLATTLPRDDVRRLVRGEIRRRVQDERGVAFPWGDFVEDNQVQKAIEVALEKLGEEPQDITEFGMVFDYEQQAEDGPGGLASLRDSGELRRARALVRQAREGGAGLSAEELEEVLSVLDSID